MSQSTTVEVVCALCGSHEREILGTFQFSGQMLGLAKCRVCGLVYVSPRLTDEAMDEYWRSYMERDYRLHWEQLQAEQLPTIMHDLDLLESYGAPGRLLDVGCGGGFFMKHAAERGWQPVGVDVSRLACDLVRQKFSLPVFCGELEDASFTEGSFDAVTCFNTFPYFANPLSKAKEMNRVLEHSGLLLVRVPNKIPYVELWLTLSSILRRNWDRESRSLDSVPIFLSNHLVHFSTSTIRALLVKARFQTVEVFNTPAVFYSSNSTVRWVMRGLNLISSVILSITGRRWCIAPSVTVLAHKAG